MSLRSDIGRSRSKSRRRSVGEWIRRVKIIAVRVNIQFGP